MAYTLMTWQNAVRAHLDGWKQRMEGVGVTSLYNSLSAATLWPVVQAAQGGEWAAIGALGAVVAGVGSNLVASRIQGWKDEADGARQLSSQLANDPQLRKELDAILQAVNTFACAQEALPAADRQWFADTLQAELKQLGNAGTFNICSARAAHGLCAKQECVKLRQIVVRVGAQVVGEAGGEHALLEQGVTGNVNWTAVECGAAAACGCKQLGMHRLIHHGQDRAAGVRQRQRDREARKVMREVGCAI